MDDFESTENDGKSNAFYLFYLTAVNDILDVNQTPLFDVNCARNIYRHYAGLAADEVCNSAE